MLRKTLAIILLAAVGAVSALAQNIQVEAPNLVSQDEQFTVRFTVSGSVSASSFSWAPGDDFTLVYGPQKGSSTSISIINGKTTKTATTSYTYILLPRTTGTFTLPAASAEISGNTVSSQTKSIEVVAPSQSSTSAQSSGRAQQPQSHQPSRQGNARVSDEDIFLKMSLSKTNVVVGEPITATLKLYTRVQAYNFSAQKLPSFSGFWSQELDNPGGGEFQREKYNDQIYNAAVVKKYLIIPQKTGALSIEGTELQCQVDVGETYGRSAIDAFFSPYTTIRKTLRTPEVKVNVSSLPSGAPDSFGGGVGTFTMDVALSKDRMNVNDAGSLIVTIKGNGNVAMLQDPKVTFPLDFETYETKSSGGAASVGSLSGTKTIEFPFIPRSYGEFVFEPVRYSYFDINTRKYVTLESKPLTLVVDKVDGVETSQDASISIPSVDRKDVKNLGEDIRYIAVRRPNFVKEGSFFVWSPAFGIIAMLIVLVAVAIFIVLGRREKLRGDVVLVKRKKATKMALRRLRKAQEYLKQNLYTAFYEELHKSLMGFASDKLGMPVVDLSRDNISARLQEGGISDSLRERFVALIEACEFARYSPDAGHDAMQKHYTEATEVISTIDSMFKNNKKAASSAVMALLLMLIPLWGSAQEAVSAVQPTADEQWEAGVQEYAAANWVAARANWEAILADGMESAALHCNIADTWFQQREYGRAILSYERALKIDPSYDDARHNLEVANSFIQDKIEPVPEFFFKAWLRKACYALSSNIWAVLSLILLAILSAMLVLFFKGHGVRARKTGFFCALAAFVLLLCTLGFAAWQKSDYMASDKAIVLSPVVSAKSSPAESTSKDLFILHEGTKVNVLETMGEWMKISLADGRQGWLPVHSVELI